MVTIISGVGPGKSGVARFFEGLMRDALESNCQLIYPGDYVFPDRRNKFSFLMWLSKWFVQRIYFLLKVIFCNKEEVLLIHPQSVGYLASIFIIIFSKKIRYYVLDSSYFCIKSYNFRTDVGECVDCLAFANKPKAECKVSPGKSMKGLARLFQETLYSNKAKVTFFLQNENQRKVMRKHFGTIRCEIVGMNTGELDEVGKIEAPPKFISEILERKKYKGFIVFHAALLPEKGFYYSLKIASLCKNYLFVFPGEKPNKLSNVADNVLFYPSEWTSGLSDLVCSADAVLCPSLWSAPVEGALLKSLLYGKRVYCVKTENGYSQELAGSGIKYLSGDFHIDSISLVKSIEEKFSPINVDLIRGIIASSHIKKIYN